jgi:predicted Zn-dependent protease
MAELGLRDRRHLDEAQGWLGLGNPIEANEALEQITPTLHAHPDVLRVRYNVYAAAKNWEAAAHIAEAIASLVPNDSFGYIHAAYALHEVKRTREAMNILLPVTLRFPDEWLIAYNLACYCCQLGDLKSSHEWLTKAYKTGNANNIKAMARRDPDLAPLFESTK